MEYFDPPWEVEAHIHSLDGALGKAKILGKMGDNRYMAEVNGVKCSAIYNPFVGTYYADDKYGIIKDTSPKPKRQGPTR